MSKIKLYLKYGSLFLKKDIVKDIDIGEAYTKVSKNYETVFLTAMHQYNDRMLDALLRRSKKIVQPKILDLACGTGYNTKYVVKQYHNPSFCLCDISAGMLEQAKETIEYEKVIYEQKNMLSYLKGCKSESFDILLCSWAIKYAPPSKVIAECRRVLKKDGYMACIVNTKFTLPEMRKVLPKLFACNLEKISKVMMALPNPISRSTFDWWFLRAGFRRIISQKGEHVFHFHSKEELVKFAISTGALAGYDQMLNLGDTVVLEQMKKYVEQYKINQLTHRFVWGVFRKR